MTDDIVTRLRAYNIGNIGHEASSHMEETLYEAADEVERLRADRDRWKEVALHVTYKWHPDGNCDLCNTYMQAVRGESTN